MPRPTPTQPVAGRSVTDDAPTFQWTPVPGAGAYRLQLAATDAFETVYYDDTVEGPTSISLDEVLPADATTVVWRVRAQTGSEAPWSTAARFDVSGTTADSGAFRVEAPPVPVHPMEGDAVDVRAAGFTWEAVPEASGYQMQVGETDALDAPTVDLTLDQTTTLTLFEMLPAETSPLYWRVRALFPNGTEGPWSETAHFGTDEAPAGEALQAVDEPAEADVDPPSPQHSPMASGPAQEAHTSSAMALTFMLVLVISFTLTLLLILWFL